MTAGSTEAEPWLERYWARWKAAVGVTGHGGSALWLSGGSGRDWMMGWWLDGGKIASCLHYSTNELAQGAVLQDVCLWNAW